MLIPYSKFILQFGIRSPMYLMAPPVFPQTEISFPRDLVIHLLDTTSDARFPTKSDHYFQNVPDSKKIPIFSLTDLTSTNETTILIEKKIAVDIRRWVRTNIKKFRYSELLTTPNQDQNTVAVVNYNTIKDIYNYKSSPVSEYWKHRNVSQTYWDTVKACLDLDKTSIQLIPINVPSVIPGMMMMNRLLGFEPRKQVMVIDDPKLFWVMEIYQWLIDESREGSPLASITDEESTRVVIELKYKGHVVYLPLNLLRSLSESSELPSSTKMSDEKIRKLFIVLLRRLQQSVESTSSLDDLPVNKEPEPSEIEDMDDTEDTDEVEVKEASTDMVISPDTKVNTDLSISDKYRELNKIKGLVDIDLDIESIIDESKIELDKLDEELDNETDYMFNSKIMEIDSGKPIKKKVEKSLGDEFGEMGELELDDFEIEELPEIEEEVLQKEVKTKSSKQIAEDFIQKAIKDKTHSASEIKSLRNAIEKRDRLKSPYSDLAVDEVVETKLPDIKLSEDLISLDIDLPEIDQSLLTDKTKAFDEVYVEKMLKKDIVSSVTNLEKAGLIIQNYEKEEVISSVDKYELHKVSIKPLNGKDTTVYFRLPIIDKEGNFMVGGKMYRMRKVRQPLPIVKVSPIRVALTTNYGKFFVSRTERKTNDRDSYLVDYIRKDYLGDSTVITKLVPGKKRITEKLPNDLVVLSSNFNEVHTNEYKLMLRPEDGAKHVEESVLKNLEKQNLFFAGYTKKAELLVINLDNQFYVVRDEIEYVGTIEDILQLDLDKVPKPFSVMKVLGSDIPLGVVLGYYLGLSSLLKLTDTKFQILGPRDRFTPTSKQLVLRFSNHKLVIETDTVEKGLLFNGFLFYKDTTRQFPLRAFNNKAVYLNMLEQRRNSLIHLREMDILRDLFLDPISIDVLKEKGEPTDYIPLLLRANSLLRDYEYPDVNDPNYSRIRGYDRVPGLMYRALAEAIREHRIKGKNSVKLSIDPYKVWNYITQDSSIKSRDTLNPLSTIKEDESVTLAGRDGLSSDAVPPQIRRYHKHDAGLISENTVDSRDVGINASLSPYAKYEGIRGTIDASNTEVEDNPGKIFSTPVQVAPMANYDDQFGPLK